MTAAPGDPRTQVLYAYTGRWHAYAAAARTADYQPGALSQYAAGLLTLKRFVVREIAPTALPDASGLQWRHTDEDTWELWARWSK